MRNEMGQVNPEPVPQAAGFGKHLVSINALDKLGFKEWFFHSGMLFNALDKWWGDKGKRNSPHEGLDICLYRTGDNELRYLGSGVKVPVLYEGEVVKIDDDFLGTSAFVCHSIYRSNGDQLLTAYGHLKLDDGIYPGKVLREGDLLGNIAEVGRRKVEIQPHLHISIAWVPKALSYTRLSWEYMGDPALVALLDPLKVLDCRYSVVDSV